MLKKQLLLLTATSLCNLLAAQIFWKTQPRDMQFYPRNLNTGKAVVWLKGDVNTGGYSFIQVQVNRNGKLYSNQQQVLSYVSGNAPFAIQLQLPAGRYQYELLVSLHNGSGSSQVYAAKNIVVGDAYLITGQSNSVANQYNGASNPGYHDSFVRSYGNSYPSPAYAAGDSTWYLADGDGVYNKGCTGQWGLVLGRKIADTFGVPVCLINAGVGGTPITFHQKNVSNPTDLNSNYGRMLYRARASGLSKNIRGIFWFQGESDGANAQLHDSLFRTMHRHWMMDYPALEKVYVVQVRTGCGNPSLELREKQRLLKDLNRCESFTANGLNAHDGCHYGFVNGYEKLGLQLFAAMRSDLYKQARNDNYFPLNPKKIYLSKGDRTELCIEFDGNATVTADTLFHPLFSTLGGTAGVISGRVKNNKVYLTLSKSDCDITGVNYEGLAGNRAWVKTSRGVALMTFYNFPVSSSNIPAVQTACAGDTLLLGADSIPGLKYSWLGLSSGFTSKRARPLLVASVNEKFRVVLTPVLPGCLPDTVYTSLVTDRPVLPYLPKDTGLCAYDSLIIRVPRLVTQQHTLYWNGMAAGKSDSFIVRDSGSLVFKAVTNGGCKAEVKSGIRKYKPLSQGWGAVLDICAGTDSTISGNPRAKTWLWNNTDSGIHYRVPSVSTTVTLRQTDSFGCQNLDSIVIHRLQAIKPNMPETYQVCSGDLKTVLLPRTHQQWMLDGKPVTDTLLSLQAGTYRLSCLDKQGCRTGAALKIDSLTLPYFNITDTGFCTGGQITMQGPDNVDEYRWSNGIRTSKSVYYNHGGYWLRVKGSNGCSFTDSFKLTTVDLPVFRFPADTFFCSGDSLRLSRSAAGAGWFYWNNAPVNSDIFIKQSGNYSFRLYDKSYCALKGQVFIAERTCTNSLSGARAVTISIAVEGGHLRISGIPRNCDQVVCFDMTGRQLWQKELRNLSETAHHIHAAPMTGILLFRMTQQGGRLQYHTEKFTITP